MENLYLLNIFKTSIKLNGLDFEFIKNDNKQIESLLLEKLRKNIGDKCSKEGFIKSDSIRILRRTLGSLCSYRLDGSLLYNVEYQAKVCLPLEGSEIKTNVVSLNKLGLLCEIKPLSSVITYNQHLENGIWNGICIRCNKNTGKCKGWRWCDKCVGYR